MEEQFEISMKAIVEEEAGKKAYEMLQIMAYFAPENIHAGMFQEIFTNIKELNAAVKLLNHYSLVKSLSETTFCIHEGMQIRIRKHLKYLNLEEGALKRAITVVLASYMSLIGPDNIRHVMSVFEFSKKCPKLLEESSKLPSFIVQELMKMCKAREASLFGNEAFAFLKQSLGAYHPGVLALQFRLGASLAFENKFKEAFELLIPLYEKESQVSGKREINDRVNLLACIMQDMEFSDCLSNEAEARLRQIIFKGVQISETKDNSVLETWIKYAELLIEHDSAGRALQILRNVAKRRRKIFGPLDDGICEAMQSSAQCLIKENKLQGAMKILESVHHKRRKILGEINVSTLCTKSDIGKVLQLQHKYAEALVVYEEVAEKFKDVLGEDHLLSIKARNDIGFIHFLRQEYDKAYQINMDLYKNHKDELVKNNVEFLSIKSNIGEILYKQEKFEEALEIFEELLKEHTLLYGPFDGKVIELKRKILFLQVLNNMESEAKTLHSFSKTGNLEKMASMIETGVEINGKDDDGKTPLHYAAEYGHTKVVRFLLEKGAIFNARSKAGTTPLQLAKSPELQNLLLTAKALLNDAKTGNREKVLQHISKESSILNVKDIHGYTALHWSAFGGHKSSLKLLLEFGADPTLVSVKGNSPLHIGALKGYREIIDLLLHSMRRDKLHDFINLRTEAGGNTVLHVAAERGFVDVVKTLLSNGAICNIRNKDGKTPRDLAKEWSCSNLLNLIHGLFIDARKGSGDIVCKLRDMDSSELLAISKAQDIEKNTLLQVAINSNHHDLTTKLVKVLKYNALN